MSSQNRMTLLFMDQDAAHPPATRLHKNVEVVFVHQNCTSILQPLDHGIIRLFKYYYHKQLARRTIVIIDHKLFHDAAIVRVNVSDVQHFIAESWHCVKCMIIWNYFQKCAFNLHENQLQWQCNRT